MPHSEVQGTRELVAASIRFSDQLQTLKSANRTPEVEWYPYDTLGFLQVVRPEPIDGQDLLSLARSGTVLDIGCGDGDLSFFLESLGCEVLAIENPQTNFNHALGFQALRTILGSAVELEHCDLDVRFDLGQRTFGLAFCLGLLYHLKNPFGFLETLAEHARYCVLSTRVAQLTVRGTPITDDPVAYLVSPTETNGDRTNYWIFSEAGLRRAFDRAGWELCHYVTTGCRNGSDPARADRDQRAFCFARSRHPAPWPQVELTGGWHGMEGGSWRWTQRVFAVRVESAVPATKLRFEFVLSDVVLDAIGPVTLQGFAEEVKLPESTYTSPGSHVYEQTISPVKGRIAVRFELDKAFAAPDGRELGLQVVFWNYDAATPRAMFPITIS